MGNILVFDFLQNAVKILEASFTQKGLEIFCADSIELPSSAFKDGAIIEPKVVSEKISEFLKNHKILTKKAIALVNPPYVFTRLARLPHNLSDSQIRLNLEGELNQYKAFSGKAVVIDFKKLEELSEEGVKKVSVLFAATFKSLSDSYLKALMQAGIDLVDLDISILSIIRLLEEVNLKSSSLDANLLMAVNGKYIEVCILKGIWPRFLHTIEMDTYDYDKNPAEFTERLASAIKLLLNFYQTRFTQGEQINSIIVNPLDAKFSQTHTLLQEKLSHVSVQVSNPLAKIYIEKDKPARQEDLRFSFSALIGAALKVENINRPFNLNLLGEQKSQLETRQTQLYLLLVALIFVLSIMVLSLIWTVGIIQILQRRLNHFDLEFKKPSPELAQAISIKNKRDTLQSQIDEANSIIQRSKKLAYFNSLTKAMVLVPRDLWLVDISLEETDRKMVLSGESRIERPIFDYITRLSGSGYFKNVELISSEGDIGRIRFVIQCSTN